MAATNFTPIQLYFSTTASAAPTAANLAQGELAININDGKLYYEDSTGAVQVIATKGAGTIGGSTTQIQYNNAGALAGNAAMVFNSGTSTTTLTTLNLTNALGAIYGGTAQSTYTQGDFVYASAANTLSKLGIGANTYILTSTGSVPQWSAPSSISVLTATNLDGGAAGSVPYQSGVATTTFLAIGAANRVMTSTGSAPQWVTALTGLTGVSSSSITDTGLTSGRVTFASTSGLLADSANLTFNGTTLTTAGLSNSGFSTLVKTLTLGDTSFNGTAVFAAATPAKLYMGTGTVTDVTSAISATNTTGAIASLAITPIAATNTGVTYTNASTLYIAGAPSAGTNITITNPYSLYVAGGAVYLGGNTAVTGTLSATGNIGALQASPVAPFQAGDVTVIQQDANSGYVGANFGGGTSGTYIKSQYAVRTIYDSATGVIGFDTAPSGTLGNAITFTRRATVSSSALALGVGVSLTGGTSGTGYSFSGTAPATSLTLDASGNVVLGSSANGGQVMTTLQGYSPNSTNGSYGNLLFSANANYSGGAYRFLLTNAYNVTDFAIISSVNATTTPTLDSGGAVSSGTAVFSLSGGGNAVFAGNVTVSNGNLIVGTAGKGIDFSADPSAPGMTSELLDDYEEGTWTSTITFGGASVGIVYTVNSGTYTKIGNVVTGRFIIAFSSIGSSTGDAVIGGLPFTVGSNLGSAVTELAGNFTSSPPTAGWPQDTTTNLNLWAMGATGVTNTTNANFANNTRLDMWFQYFV